MKIGIIGSGNIGGALTRLSRAIGHEVAVANSRDPSSLTDLARETGAHASSLEEALRGHDVVVVAIPLKNIKDLPPGLFADAPDNMIVIDPTNYYPRHRDGRIDEIEEGITESKWFERRLGHSVIKTFNMIDAALLENGTPAGTAGRIALAVAGDDPKAKATVMHQRDRLRRR